MHQLLGNSAGQALSGLSLLPDLFAGCKGPRSDASSQVSMDLGVASALGTSSRVAGLLNAAGAARSAQLLQSVRGLASVLEYATSVGSSEAKAVLDKVADVHSSIVELDDTLDRHQLSADAEECRQWLKQLQNCILSLSKQVQDCTAAEAQQCEAASTSSSMDEVGSSNSSTMGTAVCDTAWRVMCQEAAHTLSSMANQLSGSRASSDFGSPRTAGSAAGSSKLVARQSRLSYAQYWSKKIAL